MRKTRVISVGLLQFHQFGSLVFLFVSIVGVITAGVIMSEVVFISLCEERWLTFLRHYGSPLPLAR